MDGGPRRTPDQRLRVFVSSTLTELAEERTAGREAIERLHLAPVMFELGARPYPPREVYRAYLQQSQIFIGIYWQRYGWVAPGETVSGLEDEYALSQGMPRLPYVKMPAPEREPRLEQLLRRVQADDTASYKPSRTADEPARLVGGDLALLLSERFASPRRPTGVVTFLVADIDGDGQPVSGAEDGARARYDLMRSAVVSHGGYVFHSLEGAFCAAFAQPSDAALAAYDLRRALTTAERGELGPAAVRVALHNGVAELRDDGYVGVALQRLARLLAAAQGGQVLLSAAVVGLLGDPPPPPLTLRSLGVHRLSDLTRAEEIHQLVMPDLPSDFPPLRTLDRRRHNLPVQLSSFVGRERELADVKRALADGRLVTLTGVGGSGKSRLALQAAADLVDDLPDGAWLVELAPLTEPERVPSAVATALEIPEDPHRPLIETLTDELRSKRLLVLVDNCEHLLAASAQLIATLLQAAPGLRVLATSREALTVPGEVILPVSPLPVPPEGTDASALADFPAVRLFAERATAVRPEFTLTAAHAAAVVQIVTHLDGIPLALELAAARVKVCCPSSRSPPVLRTVSACSAAAPGPSCHGSRRCRRRWTGVTTCSRGRSAHCCGLSVFRGGWTVEAAETVCSGDGVDTLDVLDLLGRLVDKSLVLVVEGTDENRYRLLETVRQYGNGHLADADESTTTRTAHRDWCRSTVEAAAHVRGGEEQARWLERLESDHGSRPS